jgi:hypothetical protein
MLKHGLGFPTFAVGGSTHGPPGIGRRHHDRQAEGSGGAKLHTGRRHARRAYQAATAKIGDAGELQGRDVGENWNGDRDHWKSVPPTEVSAALTTLNRPYRLRPARWQVIFPMLGGPLRPQDMRAPLNQFDVIT